MISQKNKKLFITTAIPYINGEPHLGHVLEMVQADVVARYYRLLDYEVYFLSGTDENSLKNVRAAEIASLSIKDWVDRYYLKFYQLKDQFNFSFDDFIRTTETRHIKGVQKLWLSCQKDIYKKTYTGLYCLDCEAFYKEEELINGLCPEHKKPLELISEENYFFRLSKYQDTLIKIIETEQLKIIPQTRKNEILSFLKSGLEDICISRSVSRSRGWGIPVPNDSSQIVWVWFDALSNYINALGYATDSKLFNKWWQKNPFTLHIIGKGISRFHAVYWPAMLLSAGLKLPSQIFVHGYITLGKEKMGKSSGSPIKPADLLSKYSVDTLRYFLLREIPAYEDGEFKEERVIDRYQKDLASGLGNLFARVSALAEKSGQPILLKENDLKSDIDKVIKNYHLFMADYRFHEALAQLWSLINKADSYINDQKPWSKSGNKSEFEKNISSLVIVLYYLAKWLLPFLPKTASEILKRLSLEKIKENNLIGQKIKLKKGEPLFPKLA